MYEIEKSNFLQMTLRGNRKVLVNVRDVAHVEESANGSTITMRTVKEKENVIYDVIESYDDVLQALQRFR